MRWVEERSGEQAWPLLRGTGDDGERAASVRQRLIFMMEELCYDLAEADESSRAVTEELRDLWWSVMVSQLSAAQWLAFAEDPSALAVEAWMRPEDRARWAELRVRVHPGDREHLFTWRSGAT